MMVATNWGVYEFGKRDPAFRELGDRRDMQIRARDEGHLNALRDHYPYLGENVYLGDGVADFQWRVYISKEDLADMMYTLVMQLDYIRFKEGAAKDHKLHSVLSAFWSTLLNAYPKGSSYTFSKKQEHRPARRPRWWEDIR